ncbi:hypothetical protein SUNI508_07193 [Seiridium unicorne]|uniref:Uncharacterized protein n=1 Tax=Seiridium unicorne TaxID=138068 RepID=A0ABR2UYD6_9PEZI
MKEILCCKDEHQHDCEKARPYSLEWEMKWRGFPEDRLYNVSRHDGDVHSLFGSLNSINLQGVEETWREHEDCNPGKAIKRTLEFTYTNVPSFLPPKDAGEIGGEKASVVSHAGIGWLEIYSEGNYY